jgi:hypothetical protein
MEQTFVKILKLSAQAGQNGVANGTSVDSVAQDDCFQEARKCKRHISDNTPQRTKRLAKPVPTSVSVNLPPH